MCNFWSCVLTRDGRVLWSPDINSHEELIRRNGLDDTKLIDRDFVRLEIVPKHGLGRERGDWRYKVDEYITLPTWYESNTRHWESVVWAEWERAMEQTLWTQLWFERVNRMIMRCIAIRPYETVIDKDKAEAALMEYHRRLSILDKEQRKWAIREIRYYDKEEWDSVWDSVRDSLRASVEYSLWDSVRDSLRASVRISFLLSDDDNFALPLIECLENGCVLYGVSDDGVAHVIMVGKEGGQ